MGTKLKINSCPTCGSPLKVDSGSDIVKCEYCGSVINLNREDEEEIEEKYKNCVIRFNCARGRVDLMNLLPCLRELGDYKDSKRMYTKSLFRIEELKQQEKKKKFIKFLIPILIILCIVFTVSIKNCNENIKYDISNIKIEIVDKRCYIKDNKYYVYLDYNIENNTGETIDYISITTFVYKGGNKSIGNISSSFGGKGVSELNLQKSKTILEETYLSANNLEQANSLFYELYLNDIDSYNISYKITKVEFGDGKIITVS